MGALGNMVDVLPDATQTSLSAKSQRHILQASNLS